MERYLSKCPVTTLANFSFVKCSRRERLKFFQSSLPYLNNNALVFGRHGEAKTWALEEPHPTDQSFLTFKNGHYGIYFTLFNHELRKEEHNNSSLNSQKVIIIIRENSSSDLIPAFSISKAKQEIHNDIKWLERVTRNLLSTTSLVKLNCSFKQLLHARNLSTSAHRAKDKPKKTKMSSGDPKSFLKTTVEDIPLLMKDKSDACEPTNSETFAESFLRTQTAQILHVFNNFVSPEELNVIYPIYQSLKRNEILLPSINEYNVVLKSIAWRALDGEDSIPATEARLTSLLTVYQDILAACQTESCCHPNTETYQIILESIFEGSKKALTSELTTDLPRHLKYQNLSKVLEFCKVGIDLYISLSQDPKIARCDALPDILHCLNRFPALVNERVASLILELRDYNLVDAQFYIGLISLLEILSKRLRLDMKASYTFVSDVFDNFKRQCDFAPQLANAEFEIYSAMLQSLIASGNIPIATKFLDDIILTYKNDTSKASAAYSLAISELISDYLQALIKLGSLLYLDKAYNLLARIHQVTYLPDTNVSVYHNMICSYISEYIKKENSKVVLEDTKEVSRTQELIYKRIWGLRNYAAVRKDFFDTNKAHVNSTEMLLSLCIDLGDSQNVSLLIKEILVKNKPIEDWNVLQKLCYTLLNDTSFGQSLTFEVLWSILESQASHFENDSNKLNEFLSEFIPYIIVDDPRAFERIMNLTFIYKAFKTCNLQNDNFYGLSTLMTFLQGKHEISLLTDVDRAKILNYQAYMLNELEDTENHYMDFPPEFRKFHSSLRSLFENNCHAYQEKTVLTDAVHQALVKSDMDSLNLEVGELSSVHYKKDLTSFLKINYGKGISQFIDLFKEGFSFENETWRIVINRNFALDILSPGKLISTPDFLERLIVSGEDSRTIDHIIALISLNNDKVNIEVFKYFNKHRDHPIFASEKILPCFADFAKKTKNQYFLTLFCKDFGRLLKLNSSKGWMADFFGKLNEVERFSDVHAIVSENFELLNHGLDIRNESDESFLRNILIAYMNYGKEDEVNQIFRYHFSDPTQKKLLSGSNTLMMCLLNYYTSVGSYDMVIKHFAKLGDRSIELKQAVQFSKFLSSLSGSQTSTPCTYDKNDNSFALALLSQSNFVEMKQLYDRNLHHISNKEIFFNILLEDLTKAAKFLKGNCSERIIAKFEAIIKFCKVLRLKKISAETANNLVNFFVASNSNNLLNVLFNKFMINNSLVSSFDFYSLHVELKSNAELANLLENFESGFQRTNDFLNLNAVEQYKANEFVP